MHIRRAAISDSDAMWDMLAPVFQAGDTYAIDANISREAAMNYWLADDKFTFVAEIDGILYGTYYLKQNQAGGGAHVCNCGYITAPQARGRGIAGAMCQHSQAAALEHGFQAMQFNFVVSTNIGAIRLWQKLGFEIVGTIPDAFIHPSKGPVDAHIMYKWLAPK